MIKQIFATLTLGSIALFGSTANAQTVSFSDDFETGMDGWTIVIQDTFSVDSSVIEFEDGWITLADPSFPTDMVCGATSYFQTPGKARRWLISPAITLGSYGNFLNWSARSHDPSYPDNYQVLISETTNDISSFLDTVAWIGAETEEWYDYNLNLSDSSGYVDQVVYVAFVLNSYDKFKLYLDDISMTIDDPLALTENNLDWVEMYPNPASEILRLKTDKAIDWVQIYNSTGQLVRTSSYTSAGINVSDLESGIYFTEIKSGNTVARKRLVIR